MRCSTLRSCSVQAIGRVFRSPFWSLARLLSLIRNLWSNLYNLLSGTIFLHIRYFGIIGAIEGNLSIQQIQIYVEAQTSFSKFGMIGEQMIFSISSVVENVITILNNSIINSTSFNDLGPLYGANYANIKQIKNIFVNSSNFGSQFSNGGLIGAVGYLNISLTNITVQHTNVTSFTNGTGGMIGYVYSCSIVIKDSTINTVSLVAQKIYGIVLGVDAGYNTLNIQNSKSVGNNYINNVLQENCGSFTSIIGQVTQC
ncbi:Hypothetical_protein [Hexamita inflata]|uniref:Hypothetical_protein n=1 Tax=Hexamita inflata TaxID=28002 RepID=A0AA86PLJ2_9EUKA|nr:Hypothetical protein HINF_LOCUS29945 [Hexamita inflata]